MKVCNIPGCPTLFDGTGGRCPTHATQARRERVHNKVYSTAGHARFRDTVLTRDPICTSCHTALSTVADHYPQDRRTLVELHLNPNDPRYGRGLCAPCHNKHTAATTPSGFRA